MRIIKFAFILFAMVSCMCAASQNTKPVTSKQKLKAIKFTTLLAGYKNGDVVSAKVADSIIGLPLKIVDPKNASYTISSYQFLYRKVVTSEDEATGKTYKTSSVKSSLFKTTPLSNIWLSNIREDLKVGEELHFFDVIVNDGKGNFMYAPELKLTIK
jgi:hypothetical protein